MLNLVNTSDNFQNLTSSWDRLILKVHQWIGNLIGILWFDVLRIRRAVAIENIRLSFPEWSEDEIVKTARQSLLVMGQNIAWIAAMPFLTKNKILRAVRIVGLENYWKAQEKGKGVIALALHLGCGDLGISTLSLSGIPTHVITKRLKTQWMNRFWFSLRQRQGTRLIADRNSHFQILRALKDNELVIFVLDQFTGPPIGVRTQFLGRETGTSFGLALVAERTQATVIPMYHRFLDNGLSEVHIEKEVPFEIKESRKQTMIHMTQVYTDKLEEIVRKYPQQWMWVHRRWKTFRD